MKVSGFIFEIFYQVVLALAIFMLIYVFLLQPHQVRGHSMDPNFDNGEYILTDKISYRFGKPGRGDVIVFAAPPTNRKEDFIKRLIGLPGDIVSVSDGKVYVNDNVLEENYIPANTKTTGNQALKDGQSLTLRENEYFVMGDNREHSSDSRAWGVILKSDIVGKAWFVYWPPTKLRLVPRANYSSS